MKNTNPYNPEKEPYNHRRWESENKCIKKSDQLMNDNCNCNKCTSYFTRTPPASPLEGKETVYSIAKSEVNTYNSKLALIINEYCTFSRLEITGDECDAEPIPEDSGIRQLHDLKKMLNMAYNVGLQSQHTAKEVEAYEARYKEMQSVIETLANFVRLNTEFESMPHEIMQLILLHSDNV